MKFRIIELICSGLAFSVALFLYKCSSGLVFVYKYLAIMPLILLNYLCFPQLYGVISARKYVGLKLTLIPLSFLLLSIRLSTYNNCNILLMIAVGLMLMMVAVEVLYLFKTRNPFYRKLIFRHTLYTILAIVCDYILLLL